MQVIIQRRKASTQGFSQWGELTLDDLHQCFTLERGPRVKDHPPIPAGTYACRKSRSPHLGYVTPELLAVPGRTAIRIHVANFWDQLLGCTAVGEEIGLDLKRGPEEFAIYGSRVAFQDLMAKLPDEFDVTYLDPKETDHA